MRYRGAVNYYVNLPANPVQGDVWVVRYQGTSGQTPNGHAYCWENAPISSDKTYIGDVPAYTEFINRRPDLVNWLKEKENKGLAWAAFTINDGVVFMIPHNTGADLVRDRDNNFLYPLAFKDTYTDSGTTYYRYYLRKSNFNTQYRGVYTINWQHYQLSTGKYLGHAFYDDGGGSQWNYLTSDSNKNVYINNVTYEGYRLSYSGKDNPNITDSETGFSIYIDSSSMNRQYWEVRDYGINNVSSVYPDPTNFISSRLLLDVDGNTVTPGSSTYSLCYAGATTELQWVDLGDLGGNLPSGKGKIYYNGICYSAGGGENGKFFHREEIDTTTSNLIVVDNSTFTNPNSTPLVENIILLNESELTLIADSENECNSNIIAQEGGLITGKKISNNIILGKYNYIYSNDYFKNAIILGQSNHYASSITPNSDSNPILIGYNNTVECDGALETSTVDVPYILLGSNNTAYEQSDTENSYYVAAIGNSNTIKGTKSIAIGYNVLVSGEYTNSSDQTSYWGNNTVLGNDINVSGSYIKALGRNINFGNSSEMVLIGQSLNGANAYESAVIGYYDSMYASSCCGNYGVDNYNFASNSRTFVIGSSITAQSDSYSHIIGYLNTVNGSYYAHILGYNNIVNGVSSYGAYVLGYENQVMGGNDSYVIGSNNQSTGCTYNWIIGKSNALSSGSSYNIVIGEGIQLTTLSNKIRIGFYPLTNDDFFAIGDGEGYSRSSVFRIDSNKNFYLNSIVPLPPVPSADGTYALSVVSGASSWVTGGGGGSTVIANPSGAATDSLTKISIDNVIYSLSGTGTYVEANPSGTGSTDLTSVEIGSTIYNIPQGINVVANPSGTASTDLTKVEIGSTIYSIPEGTAVEANPVASATDTLTKLEVGSTVYEVPQGTYVEANPSGSATTTLSSIQIGSTVYEISSSEIRLTGTLTAGNTTLTISDNSILSTSVIDVYVDTWGVAPYDVQVTTGSVALTFYPQANDVSIIVIVR